jgi:UDP:flavonoid glycosyltransferase YjiC (YdhE family)
MVLPEVINEGSIPTVPRIHALPEDGGKDLGGRPRDIHRYFGLRVVPHSQHWGPGGPGPHARPSGIAYDAEMSHGSAVQAGVIVFGSPVSVGHVRPLMPLAKRFVQRGFPVVWAISGDANEPAAVWRKPLTELGVQFVDIDDTAMFSRGTIEEFASTSFASALRRVTARANDVSDAAAAAIATAVDGRPIVCGIYDFFALWSYVAMRRLGVANIDVVISAFPPMIDALPPEYMDDPVYLRELDRLRARGVGSFDAAPRNGVIPSDPSLRLLSFSSPRLCPDPPADIRLLGIQRDALPRAVDIASAPPDHRALATRLRTAREDGARVVLLSMGTVVTRLFARFGGAYFAFLKRLYTTIAAAALRSGATVVASTCESSAEDLGLDEAALGPAARERVVAMPFVPQPLLFAHGLIDVMLMHGGANTFHEAVVSGIPLLVCPAFGDQEFVARAADRLGVGVCIESMMIPSLPGAVSLERVADEVLPAMLQPGVSRWKAVAISLAAEISQEDGLDAAEALVLGPRG